MMMHKTGGNMTGAATVLVSSSKTLKDYIALKQESSLMPEKKKLTFEEWYKDNPPYRFNKTEDFNMYIAFVWKAAQENKK